MNPDEYSKKIEAEILDVIQQRLSLGLMTPERAKEIAQYVLEALHPPLSLDEVYDKVSNFDQHFPELSDIVTQEVRNHEDLLKENIVRKVHELLVQNKIAEADTLLKSVDTTKL